MPELGTVAVIGASSRIGRKLLARLQRRGVKTVAIGRSESRLGDVAAARRVVDFADREAFWHALADTDAVVSCAPLAFLSASAILEALPDRPVRVILTGSTRRFTRFPDQASAALTDAEAALAASGRPGVILHATMIIGEGGGRNVERVAAVIKRFGIVPLPRRGAMLVQPIYTGDVAACLESALDRVTTPEPPIVIGGSQAVPYRDLVAAVGAAIGRKVRTISVPAPALMAIAEMMRILPLVPRIEPAEIRRLLEDKDFDIGPMRQRLGIEPIGIEDMLRRTFASPGDGSRP